MILGVSKVAQSGFLSGLNSLTVCSMKDAKYQPYFGFTEPEVKILLPDKLDKMERVKEYYNGYIVPFLTKKDKEKPVPMSVFNPWSIVSYKETNKLESFWMNTSSTLILKDFLQRTMDIPKFNELILEKPTKNESSLQHDMSYTNIKTASIQEIITFMFNVGFLTQDEEFKLLRVPNEEIRGAMISMLKEIIVPRTAAPDQPYSYFQEGKIDDFGSFLMQVMFQAFSSFDFTKDVQEYFYHAMMVTLWYPLSQDGYKVSSNVNCGRGRCDLIIYPFVIQDPPIPAVLFEFKKADSPKKENRRSDMESSAQIAMNQIAEKLYSYVVPSSCHFMYEVGISFYQREFFFLWNKRERVSRDPDRWSAPLESGSFCSLDSTLYSERVLEVRE
jgi:predicted AAA-ATPase/PD-(D/E)XK nuclease superfamily protein